MPRFAANLSMMFNELPFLERFAAAKAAGFGAVEFLFPYEHAPEVVAEQLAANGLELALFNLPPGDWVAGERGLAALPERREDFRRSLEQALPYARALKPPRLHLMAGIARSHDAGAIAAYEEAVARAADLFGAEGVGIVIEPINTRDIPGYFLHDFDRAAELIGRLGRPNLRLQFDIYHRQILRGDVSKGIEQLLPIIRHVQVASVPLRAEPMSGELNDAAIFELLDRRGYQGYIGCEYRPAAGTEAGLSWFAPYRPG